MRPVVNSLAILAALLFSLEATALDEEIPVSVRKLGEASSALADRAAGMVAVFEDPIVQADDLTMAELALLQRDATIAHVLLADAGGFMLIYTRIELGSGQRLRVVEIVKNRLLTAQMMLKSIRQGWTEVATSARARGDSAVSQLCIELSEDLDGGLKTLGELTHFM